MIPPHGFTGWADRAEYNPVSAARIIGERIAAGLFVCNSLRQFLAGRLKWQG